MKPRIFIYMHYLEVGGAERALLGLLHSLDPEKVDVDLFLNQHTGEFLEYIPDYVNLLPQLPEYSAIERSIAQIVKEGHLGIAARRLFAKMRHHHYHKTLTPAQQKADESIYQYVFRSVMPSLRDLSYLGEYDLAISYMHPHNIVRDKVKAKRKVCWIHTDYSTIYVNHDLELPIWDSYDKIACISDDAAKAFVGFFPELEGKIIGIENIISEKLINQQAGAIDVSAEMPQSPDRVNLLSIGRYSVPKRFEYIPRMCRILADANIDFHWYIIGFGPDEQILANIKKYGVESRLTLLGKKPNPYPYIKACDIYVQPSLYEGKSVTVREAQILHKPVLVSNYPTAKSQLTDGVDGVIVPLEIDYCAKGLIDFINDKETQDRITQYLGTHNLDNSDEIQKIYNLI